MMRIALAAMALGVGLAGCGSNPGGPGEPEPPEAEVVVTAVSPSTLVEGQPATITGRGFGLVASNNKVTVDGVVATVTAASATSLGIVVPYTGCKPERTVDVQVRLLASPSNVLRHSLRPYELLTMAVGEQLLGRDPAGFCLQFPASTASEAYLIGVQSISEEVTTLTPAVVAASAAQPGAAPILTSLEQPVFPVLSAPDLRVSRERSAEARIRALDREFLLRTGRRSAPRPPGVRANRVALPAGLQVGNLVSIRVPEYENQCDNFVPITAIVRRITGRSIWLEDIANPPSGYNAAEYQALSAFFDGSVYETEADYFGAVSDIDGNGRIAFVVTRQVNRMGADFGPLFTLGGFVKPVNYFDAGECPSSNEGEIVYLIAPDPQGSEGKPTRSAEEEAAHLPVLLAHEFVHVIQFAHQILGDLPASQPSWLIEGQATFGEEVVGHRVTGRQPGKNYGFAIAYNQPVLVTVNWYRAFSGLSYYFGYANATSRTPNAPEQCSWVGMAWQGNDGPCADNDVVVYDVGWSLLRWMSDRYGPSLPNGEKQLQRTLVDSPQPGFARLTAATGQAADVVLAQWAAALYVDDRFPGMAPGLGFSSWNLFDIDTHKAAQGRLLPRERGFGGFTDQVSVRAGSTAYFRVSGAGHAATAIRVKDAAGGNLPAWMRVWIVRLQ